MKKRVVVAMSGGVDSSVAAALLKQQGYEVVGMTMCFSLPASTGKKPSCCGLDGIDDARRVAHSLGIKHYVVGMQKYLQEKVIKDFCEEYALGRTPNPCVRCNRYLKFDVLLKKAIGLGADFLATGHYARIKAPGPRGQGYLLRKAKDKFKDQSYFLYHLGQAQLKHVIFPLGDYTKDQVRGLAREFGLPVADKAGSQEICFLPDNDYRSFLKARLGDKIKPGRVIDRNGVVLGRHKGVAFYTIGQREGLGIALGYPAYIIDIIPARNIIVVGRKEDVLCREFLVKSPHFINLRTNWHNFAVFSPIGAGVKKRIALRVKIRYNHKESPAELCPAGNKLKVTFKIPQFAVTAGQSAVFYAKDAVVGGGIIDKRINNDDS